MLMDTERDPHLDTVPVGSTLYRSDAAFLEHTLRAEGIGATVRRHGKAADKHEAVYAVYVAPVHLERALDLRRRALEEDDAAGDTAAALPPPRVRRLTVLSATVLGVAMGARVGSHLRSPAGPIAAPVFFGIFAAMAAVALWPGRRRPHGPSQTHPVD